LTKPELADPAVKCALATEETGKIDLGQIGKMLQNNPPEISSIEAVSQQMSKSRELELAETTPRMGKLDNLKEGLYNMELGRQPEKALKIDLDLYQMEDF